MFKVNSKSGLEAFGAQGIMVHMVPRGFAIAKLNHIHSHKFPFPTSQGKQQKAPNLKEFQVPYGRYELVKTSS